MLSPQPFEESAKILDRDGFRRLTTEELEKLQEIKPRTREGVGRTPLCRELIEICGEELSRAPVMSRNGW